MSEYKAELERLLQQEDDLQFPEFTNHTAFQIGCRLIEKAVQESKSIAVTIVRDGEMLFHSKMEGTNAGNDSWIKRKSNVVHHFGHSSYYMHVLFKSNGSSIESSSLDSADYAAEGGAFPLILKNVGIVGTIAASGLPGDQDHQIIVSVLEEFLRS
ncbi:heme-degrading domain-containing protein [Paenibacillus solisilvae]|uniref:Heme-degrading domain-containing protein n=1 Tax=Paenibacillus solisilvae TaxID=2486751 RepID=A0ABW0W3L1_9BACL